MNNLGRSGFIGFIGCLLLAGCGIQRPNPSSPLVVFEASGARCPSCNSSTTITYDGTVLYRGGLVKDPYTKTVRLEPADLAMLQVWVETTDFDSIQNTPFLDDCPTIMDGHKHVYSFFPPQGEVVLDECIVAIDHTVPLFKFVEEVLWQKYGDRMIYSQ